MLPQATFSYEFAIYGIVVGIVAAGVARRSGVERGELLQAIIFLRVDLKLLLQFCDLRFQVRVVFSQLLHLLRGRIGCDLRGLQRGLCFA